MQGYSPKLPLTYDSSEDGAYTLNKTINDVVKQNLRMLLLTNPGERIMDSGFGVGIRRYLFEQDVQLVREELFDRINQQVKKYLNYVQIEEIEFSEPNSNEENLLFISITYSVPSLNIKDELNIKS